MSTKRLQAKHAKHAALRRQAVKRDRIVRTMQQIIKRKSN